MPGSNTRGALLVGAIAVALPGVAEPADTGAPAPLPAAEDLAGSAMQVWNGLRDALLPEPADPALGRAIAVRLLRATAGVAVAGVPLPAVAARDVPDLEMLPVRDGILSSSFGRRRDPIHGRSKLHRGVDFSADRGAAVYAAAAGIVIKAEYRRGYGRVVYIDHGAGFVTRYAHLSRMVVREGDAIGAGTRIGAVGSTGRATGPHLHFELRVLGHAIDPLPALGIERRRFSERLGDLLELPLGERTSPRQGRRARRLRDRS